tara:strand:+ start:720 stop:1157 length:438 start_codon:yes stop_codon:yes gene_type:complete
MAFKMKKFSGFKELVGNQAKLDKNNSGSIDAEDFKILRNESPNKIITYPYDTTPDPTPQDLVAAEPTSSPTTGGKPDRAPNEYQFKSKKLHSAASGFTKKEDDNLKASLKQVEESKISSMNQDERKKDQAKQSSALKMLGIKKSN